MRYPGGIRDARAGRSVFPLCDRGFSGPVWPGSQPTLAQAAAHGDFQAASACPGQMASRTGTDRTRRGVPPCDLLRIRGMAARRTRSGECKHCGGDVGGTKLPALAVRSRSEEHTSELKSLMRISYADF